MRKICAKVRAIRIVKKENIVIFDAAAAAEVWKTGIYTNNNQSI